MKGIKRRIKGLRRHHDAAVDARLRGALRELAAARARVDHLRCENLQILQQVHAKSLFLANLSHELRTPLNAIIGFADLLGSGAVPADSPKREQFLRHIETSGRHLLQLINDVLELSKVDAGRHEFVPEVVDLGRVIAQVLDVLHTRIVCKRLRVTVDVEASLGPVVLDPARLKQALMNYLAHAIRVTPDHGIVRVRAVADGPEQVRIDVEDAGGGLSPEHQARMFAGMPHAGDAAGSQASAGLGLALTQRLVEAQGGIVGASGTPGSGTTLFLVLPRVPSSQVAEGREGPGSSQAVVATGAPSRHAGPGG